MSEAHEKPSADLAGAPLTAGLRWLAAALMLLVTLFVGVASFIDREIEDQFVLLETANRLDDTRDQFFGLLGDQSAKDIRAHEIEINLAMRALEELLSELESTAPHIVELRTALSSALDARIKVNGLVSFDESGLILLGVVSEKTDKLLLEVTQWAQQIDLEEIENSRRLKEVESTLRRLNTQRDLLTKALLANLRIRNELEAFLRYRQTKAGQDNPLSKVTISTKGLPAACDGQDKGNADRLCQPSSARVHNEIKLLLAQGSDYSPRQVTRVSWALEAYERASEIRLNKLQAELQQALTDLGEARARVDTGTRTLGSLSQLMRTLRQMIDMEQALRFDINVDLRAMNALVVGLMGNIGTLANKTTATSGLSQNRIDFSLEQIGTIEDYWTQASVDLQEREILQSEFRLTLLGLDAALSAISDQIRADSDTIVSRVTNLAIMATLVLVLFAGGVIWAGHAYVSAPLRLITLTILALARKEKVQTVSLGRRWLGLGVLEDAMERLRESEAQFRTASDLARVGRWRSTTSGALYWSPETMELFGVAPDTFTGNTDFFYNMVHPDDVLTIKDAMAEAFTTNQKFSVVHRLIKPSGEIATVYERADVIRDTQGDVVGLNGVVQDISDTVELRERLQQSQKLEMIGQLTGGVAHDFNNLLAVIVGSLELAVNVNDPEELAELMEMALSASKRGADLTQNMLAYARQSRLAPKVLDLNEIIQETESWAMRVLPANVEVNVQTTEQSAKVLADPGLMQTSLLNLIINARDAMPEGGNLTVETNVVVLNKRDVNILTLDLEPGPYIELCVSDTGTGIEPHVLEKIFEPFYTTKAAGAGTGLGLPMIQGFMVQSRGDIHVTSAVGIGTTVALYFPAHESLETGLPTEPAHRDVSAQRRLRILVAEDDPDVRSILTNMLVQEYHTVTAVHTGDDALVKLKSDARFDLLMTDVVMPGVIQGNELVDHARKLFPDMPIIVISGYANMSGLDADYSDEQVLYLKKPLHKSELYDAIGQVI